jgi:ribosomal protein S18 acetylase RimI-like enzyme
MLSQTSIGNTTIRNVQLQDILIVKDLITRMLTDAPYAFGETLAEAQGRTIDEWQQYVENTMTSPGHSAYIAFDQAGACGFIAGDKANPQAPPGTVVVGRLWVASRQRGTGLGRKLMDTITAWARDQNAQFIGLGVTEMNVNAIKFYEHLGYMDTGIRFPLPWDPVKQIIMLGQKL